MAIGKRVQIASTDAVIRELLVRQNALLYGDSTVKQDLRVEGRIFGVIASDVLVTQAQDFKIHKDLLVQDDATVKDDLRVEGLIFGTLSDPPTPAAHDHDYSSPIFNDTTVKDDLRVEGLIFGTLADAPIPAAHDHDYSSPIFSDTTVKDSLYIERDIVTVRNITWTGSLSPEGIDVFEINDLTPDISGGNVFYSDNTAQTIITNFDGATNGKSILIIFRDIFTHIESKANANIYLQGDKDFRGDAGDTLELVSAGGQWYEKGRSLNS